MSFSSDVKDELELQLNTARHCRIAELAAIVSMCGHVKISANNKLILKIHTENIVVARKSFTLIQKTFNISTEIIIRSNSGNTNKVYT